MKSTRENGNRGLAERGEDCWTERWDRLYSAVIADVLDGMGLRQQALGSDVRPLTGACRVWGRVFPARAEAVDTIPAEPYRLEMRAIDSMRAGDVLVVDAGFHRGCALWGELLSTACLAKGVRGVVMSACTRDLWRLEGMGFPVFGIGIACADSKGRLDVVEIGEPVSIGGVQACLGDIIFGDSDGVVVIPNEVAGEVVRLAAEKVGGEDAVRSDLAAGVPVEEVFRKYGIL